MIQNTSFTTATVLLYALYAFTQIYQPLAHHFILFQTCASTVHSTESSNEDSEASFISTEIFTSPEFDIMSLDSTLNFQKLSVHFKHSA